MDRFYKIVKPLLFLIVIFNSVVLDICAKEVVIGVGHTRRPYIIKETDSGVEIDVIRAAFSQQGYMVNFRYLTNTRLGFFLKKQKVDGILMNKAYDVKKNLDIDAFYSNVHITYHNYAISLFKNHFSIFRVNDLADKNVIGFQDAHKYLGPEFANMAGQNPNYMEKPEQLTQVYWLFLNRTQVVVADKLIFMYHRKNALKEGRFDVTDPVRFHNIFPPSQIHGVFLDRQIRDNLNKGLKKIRATGLYDKILKKYNQQLKPK
ncbi:MAG: transporter substrate-binding domain-containing protein [Desulfobacula sp.]|nr:transporter substrate-binding domain-containing protein [Desulfobacula sp.]